MQFQFTRRVPYAPPRHGRTNAAYRRLLPPAGASSVHYATRHGTHRSCQARLSPPDRTGRREAWPPRFFPPDAAGGPDAAFVQPPSETILRQRLQLGQSGSDFSGKLLQLALQLSLLTARVKLNHPASLIAGFRWLLGHRTCAPPSTILLLQKVYLM